MSPLRPLLLAAALLAGLLTGLAASPVGAAPHRTAAVPLTATTVVETSRSGTADVLLSRSATLSADPGDNPDVVLTGAGRLVGVWLEPLGDAGGYLAGYRLPAFAGGERRTWGSADPACRPTSGPVPLVAHCDPDPGARILLPRGFYRMTVLADGAPLKVVLRLRGLEEGTGSVGLRPLASRQQELPVRETVGSSLVTFGAVADLGVPVGTMLVARATTGPATAPAQVQEASTCERPDDGAAPLSFGPKCPGGTSGGYSWSADVAGQGTQGAGVFVSSSTEEHTGPVGLGGSFGDSRGVTLRGTLGVWVELR